MEVTKERLWSDKNRLIDTKLHYIKTLAKRKKIKVQETVHHGYEALFFTSGLETYKVVINTDECRLNILGKNMVGNSQNQYHHIKDIDYKTDSWFEVIQFIGGLIGKKRGEYICLGKRFYRKSEEYG